MTLGERIKELRIQKGLSQDELALKMGYRTRSSINKIEKGLNIVPLKKLEKLAKILGTTTEYLINGTNSILPEPIIENLGIEIVPKIETINEVDYVSSRTIAEQLGKRHNNLVRDIDNIVAGGLLRFEHTYR